MLFWFIGYERSEMLKFKFNHQANTLAYQKPFSEYWDQIEEQFEGNFGSQGFQLKDGWISFTVYSNKVRVFYKQIAELETDDFWEPAPVAYFRKDLTKYSEIVFSFTPEDQVEKKDGRWVKRGKSHA